VKVDDSKVEREDGTPESRADQQVALDELLGSGLDELLGSGRYICASAGLVR
jgi:hypothetical protein